MWQSSLDDALTNPPEEMPMFIDFFGNEVYEGETFYDINGVIISEDGLESAKVFTTDEDDFECAICGEELTEENVNFYYLIDGERFCETCVKDCECLAEK